MDFNRLALCLQCPNSLVEERHLFWHDRRRGGLERLEHEVHVTDPPVSLFDGALPTSHFLSRTFQQIHRFCLFSRHPFALEAQSACRGVAR
jgi:hypothetical protein